MKLIVAFACIALVASETGEDIIGPVLSHDQAQIYDDVTGKCAAKHGVPEYTLASLNARTKIDDNIIRDKKCFIECVLKSFKKGDKDIISDDTLLSIFRYYGERTVQQVKECCFFHKEITTCEEAYEFYECFKTTKNFKPECRDD